MFTVVMQLHVIGLELTFARLHAFRPAVIDIFVAISSAVLEPSTARSATTDSAGFLKRTALWARHLIARGDGERFRVDWCGDWCADY